MRHFFHQICRAAHTQYIDGVMRIQHSRCGALLQQRLRKRCAGKHTQLHMGMGVNQSGQGKKPVTENFLQFLCLQRAAFRRRQPYIRLYPRENTIFHENIRFYDFPALYIQKVYVSKQVFHIRRLLFETAAVFPDR